MRRIWLAAATIAAGFLASGCSDRITPARNIQAAAARAVHITAAAAAKDMSADEFYSVNGQGPYVVTGVVSSTGNRNGYYAELETGGASSTVCRFGKRDPDVRTGRKISVFADTADRVDEGVSFWPCTLLNGGGQPVGTTPVLHGAAKQRPGQ